MKKKSRISKILGYIYIPVLFCIVGYLILGVALAPVWELAYGTFNMFSAKDAPNFNPELTSIYNPNSGEETPLTVYTEEPEEDIIINYEYISAENIDAPDEEEAEQLTEHYLYIEYSDTEEVSEQALAYLYVSDEEVENVRDAKRVAFAYVEPDDQGRETAYIYLTDEDAENVSADRTYDYKAYLDELGLDKLEEGQQIVLIDEEGQIEEDAAGNTGLEDVAEDTPSEDASVDQNPDDVYVEQSPEDATDIQAPEDEFSEHKTDVTTADDTMAEVKTATNAYVISRVTSDGNVVAVNAEDPGAILYKRINFQNVLENLATAKKYIHIEDIDFPISGTHYGQLVCDRIELDCPVYWNDTSEILRYGAGQYLGSYLPGFGRMILLSAHNNTFFAPLKQIQKNDIIEYHTHYGTYKYRVREVKILNENELERYIMQHVLDEHEELILYTCYPFEATVGRKTDRLTVFAERVEGYDVKWRDLDE